MTVDGTEHTGTVVMYMLSLKKEISCFGDKINAPKEAYPLLEKTNQESRPYIEFRFPYYYLVVNEHGAELSRKSFRDKDLLLYEVFEKITFDMALQYELRHRNNKQDFRRILFEHQLQLMEALSVEWKSRLKTKIEAILKEYPYQDA